MVLPARDTASIVGEPVVAVTVAFGIPVTGPFIEEFAKANGAEWENVLPMLRNLADSNPMYREAMDTVVREMVYDACAFTSDFYV